MMGVLVAAVAMTATSPDGRNEIRLYDSPLAIEVLRDGQSVVGQSPIGLTANGTDVTNAQLVAHNDGVAYRFETKMPGEITIDDERTDLSLPPEAKALVYKTTKFGCEESVPQVMPVGKVTTAPNEMVYLPLVYTVKGTTVAITESDLYDYPCWNLKRKDTGFVSVFSRWPRKTHRAGGWNTKTPIESRGRWEVIDESENCLVKTAGTRTLPWRVFILADAPSKLCESDIVDVLARPAEGDFSWVKPGKVAWDWWNAFDNIGDPEGCTTKTYERFIDFASANGVEYVIFDEGWSERLNIWKFHPNVDVPHLVKYAAERHVGIILWIAWAQAVGDEAHVAEEFAKLGISGFKVDFMDRGDAQVERFLWKFADECAKRRLVVDYHGVHRPTGMSRTFPNVLNYEGIHGLEQMKWFPGTYSMVANDVAAFYGRLTAGPMDYTPGAMDNYPVGQYPRTDKAKGIDMRVNPGSEGTRCHQMAMMALYFAPLQMLSDSPTKYEKNMECFRFMAATPTVWERTVGLGGDFDTYAACARKAKDGGPGHRSLGEGAWYVAALNNATGRVITIGTAFLGEGEWTMESFRDAEDANENPTHYLHETKSIKAGEKMTVPLARGGGFVARFRRVHGGFGK